MSALPTLKGESLKIIAILILGWTVFSFTDASSKHLTQSYSASHIISITAILNLTLVTLWILLKKGINGFKSKNWKWLISRAIFTGLISYSAVNAFALIPIADVYGIAFTAPFLTVILAVILLKEHVHWHRWLAVIVGFIGVIILVGPQFETLNIGILFAVIAACCIAVNTIVIRMIGKNEYTPLLILYGFIGMIAINLPIAVNDIMTISPLHDIGFFLLNALLLLTGVTCTTYGLSKAKSVSSVAPFIYVQVIWGVILGYLLFDDIPTYATISGLTIVVGAGLYMIYREQDLNKVKN